jgi:hypothetical protein
MHNSSTLEEGEALSIEKKTIRIMSPAKSKNGLDTGQQQAKNLNSSPHRAALMQVSYK